MFLKSVLFIIAFITLSSFNLEYLVNRQSSTLLFVTAMIIELLLVYILIYLPFKKYFKN